MPEIGTLQSIHQNVLRPMKVQIANVEFGDTPYEGAYEFTPTEQAQVIQIAGKTASRDINIAAIPQNYGRLTWQGNKLTVS